MKRLTFILMVFFLLAGNALFAQPPGPGDNNDTEDPPCWPPPCVPIDGGLAFLLAAGLAYGGKKVHDLSKGSFDPAQDE